LANWFSQCLSSTEMMCNWGAEHWESDLDCSFAVYQHIFFLSLVRDLSFKLLNSEVNQVADRSAVDDSKIDIIGIEFSP